MPQEKLERIYPNQFFIYNHMRTVLTEKDHAISELEVCSDSLNPYHHVHGGVFYTLADNAAGAAIHTDGRLYVTQTSTMHHFGNTTEGHTLRAEARVRRRGKSTALAEVSITDETGRELALGEFVFFCIGTR